MSEQRAPLESEIEPPNLKTEPRYENHQPAQTHREEGDELVVISEGQHLSADQRRTARGLHRLYQSLCGGKPGQYWPQALLDTAGSFNRPAFPFPDRGRE